MAENMIATVRLLVVSREPQILRSLWSIGEANSWQLETALSGWDAMERVQSGLSPDLLLLDLPRGDGDSLHILRWLRRLRPELRVLVLCHPEDGGRKKEATRLGAEDVLVRPFTDEQLERLLDINYYMDMCWFDWRLWQWNRSPLWLTCQSIKI